MPYARPTLDVLMQQAAQDLQAALQGSDPLLRFSNLRIMMKTLAGQANQQYGYLDWISRMSVPFTSEDEFLYAWGALVGVFLKEAVAAGDRANNGGGQTTFSNCTVGIPIPAATPLVRGDGVNFVTLADVIVAGDGTAVCDVMATDVGAAGNSPVGIILTLGTSIAGIQTDSVVSTAITGGADIETQPEFRNRMLKVYQEKPQGGAATDYESWALGVQGVTRAWCVTEGMGVGTVLVYFMEDDVEAAHGGFPQGSNGVATAETRGTPATGDQLVVANAIYPLRPVTAIVYAAAPLNNQVAFTISGTTDADVRTAIGIAIDDVFRENASPGGTVNIIDVQGAIDAVPNIGGAAVVSPSINIVSATGYLATRGAITWT